MPVEQGSTTLKKSGLTISYYGRPDLAKTPLLFIHGSGSNGLLWYYQLKDLAIRFSPVAVDLPGHGKSAGVPAEKISLYCDYIKEFTESLNFPSFVMIGHSLGGAIALSYLLQYPADLKGLILVSTGARLRVADRFMKTLRQGKLVPEMYKYLYGPEADQGLVEKGKEIISAVSPGVFLADFTACNDFDVMEQLWNILVPTLVLCGDQDLMTPPKYSRFLAGNIPEADLEIIPGSGHLPMLEKSMEVNKGILNFLEKL
ncbi:MAG: alpha/beta hydrolase [Bacillota bacterium]|nr:alpha/beta hydrolase [Bacillota bacterium]